METIEVRYKPIAGIPKDPVTETPIEVQRIIFKLD